MFDRFAEKLTERSKTGIILSILIVLMPPAIAFAYHYTR